MDRNRRPPFKKRPNPNFKRGGGGGGNKRGKFGEQSSENTQISETVYRILCPSRKIGSVIGKGGGIVKSLREETQAKITVAESVPGSEERVIIINSPSAKLAVNNHNHEMEVCCAAQDALLKVHDKIVAEDIVDVNETVVIARLLVPNNMVGCVLGKKGDVIQRLRSETGASIRVMPADQLPTCAVNTDELVQISAKVGVAKNALYQISTLLHQNPRKDKPPSSFHTGGGHGSHRPGPANETIPPMGFIRPDPRGAPQFPWTGGHASEPPARFGHDGFEGPDTLSEFSMKILCPPLKIGGVIGIGGINVRQLQQETGTNIDVDDAIGELDERVIRVSSIEASRNPRSRTIDAIFFLQDKTCDHNEKGIITTRLLIPSNKVGCIIGQGGQVINEMRRRTRAEIRVYPKEEKPRCAGEDEELVQVSGSYGVCKDALGEIASRFRARYFRDAKPGPEPSGFVPRGNLPPEGPPASGVMRLGGHEAFKGGYPPPPPPPREYEPRVYIAPEYEPHGYPNPVPPHASGYPGSVDMKMPNSGRVSAMGPGGVHTESSGSRVQAYDPYGVSAEGVGAADVYGGYDGQKRPHQVTYNENYSTQHGPFSDINSSSTHTPYYTTTTAATTTATTAANPSHHLLYPVPVQVSAPVPPQQAQAQAHYPEPSYQYGQ